MRQADPTSPLNAATTSPGRRRTRQIAAALILLLLLGSCAAGTLGSLQRRAGCPGATSAICQDDLAGCPPLDLTPLLIADWPSDRKTIEDVLDVSLVRSHPAFLSYATSTDEIGFTGSFYYASHDYPHAFNGDWIWGLLRLVMVGYNDSSVRFWVLVTSDPAGRTGHTEELYSQVTRSASKVYSRPDSFVQGQHGDLSYCYSYLRGDYADVPLGCLLPGNSYERFLVVRKRNVIIKISEYTWTAKTLRMQEAIDALGAALRRD